MSSMVTYRPVSLSLGKEDDGLSSFTEDGQKV